MAKVTVTHKPPVVQPRVFVLELSEDEASFFEFLLSNIDSDKAVNDMMNGIRFPLQDAKVRERILMQFELGGKNYSFKNLDATIVEVK